MGRGLFSSHFWPLSWQLSWPISWPKAVLQIGVALVFTIQARPASALTFVEMEFTCPIDDAKFVAKVVGSQSQFGMRLDLRPLGALMAPDLLPVCPGNGFVMFKDKFSTEEISRLKPIVLGEEYRNLHRNHTNHYLVAHLRERMGADDLELAHLYLKASWEAETRNDPGLLAQYRSLALGRLETALTKIERSPVWWNAAVLAAELERLLGRFEDAEKRLDRLPAGELDADSALHKAMSQIRSHVRNRDASPSRFDSN